MSVSSQESESKPRPSQARVGGGQATHPAKSSLCIVGPAPDSHQGISDSPDPSEDECLQFGRCGSGEGRTSLPSCGSRGWDRTPASPPCSASKNRRFRSSMSSSSVYRTPTVLTEGLRTEAAAPLPPRRHTTGRVCCRATPFHWSTDPPSAPTPPRTMREYESSADTSMDDLGELYERKAGRGLADAVLRRSTKRRPMVTSKIRTKGSICECNRLGRLYRISLVGTAACPPKRRGARALAAIPGFGSPRSLCSLKKQNKMFNFTHSTLELS